MRYLRMLKEAGSAKCAFYFSPEHVIDYCAFAEKLEQVEDGNWRFTQVDPVTSVLDKHIILEPWQIWIESAIHGFRYRGTGERVVTRALEVSPRKSAKSLRLAIAALYDLCCGGHMAPQIVLGAATEDQADRVFSPAALMVGKDMDLITQYGLRATKKIITASATDGEISKLNSIGENQDGLNPSLAIFDEGHAGARSVYAVVRSAFGARPNALLRMITTAGYQPEGPAWELIQEAITVLNGGAEDYSFFAAVYTLDETDYLQPETKTFDVDRLLKDVALMVKANPMWDISVIPRKIFEQASEASRRPDKRNEFFRTRYNLWTNSGLTLIEPHAWAACKRKIALEDFMGMKCWIGIDLGQRLDMCSIGLVFEVPAQPEPILAVFAKYFLPEQSPTATDPDLIGSIMAWKETGDLILTPGILADHDRVRKEVEAFCDFFDVQVIACDPHQAHNTAKQLWDAKKPVMIYPNSAATMTGPTDDIISRVVAQRIFHDGNPVLSWNVANVHGERKGNGVILPRKEDENSKRKIDGFVALCFANGCRIQPEKSKDAGEVIPVDPYAVRGMLGYQETVHGR